MIDPTHATSKYREGYEDGYFVRIPKTEQPGPYRTGYKDGAWDKERGRDYDDQSDEEEKPVSEREMCVMPGCGLEAGHAPVPSFEDVAPALPEIVTVSAPARIEYSVDGGAVSTYSDLENAIARVKDRASFYLNEGCGGDGVSPCPGLEITLSLQHAASVMFRRLTADTQGDGYLVLHEGGWANHKLEAMKLLIKLTGLGLTDAKDAVEAGPVLVGPMPNYLIFYLSRSVEEVRGIRTYHHDGDTAPEGFDLRVYLPNV